MQALHAAILIAIGLFLLYLFFKFLKFFIKVVLSLLIIAAGLFLWYKINPASFFHSLDTVKSVLR